MGKIFSPGKLLLTAEYAVLDGALALAVPTKPGQDFFCQKVLGAKKFEIFWQASVQGTPWLSAKIDYKNWVVLSSNLPENAAFVLKLLKNAALLNPEKFNSEDSFNIKTNLQFPSNYGLGSSSTLINNVAEWAGCDPFLLNDMSLGGSGYDVAIAQKKSAILYKNIPGSRVIENINYSPAFKDHLLFIHLNQKQDSREGISLYREKKRDESLIKRLSEITTTVIRAENLSDFSELMAAHEGEISDFLGIATVKQKFFRDYPGIVKSLGAWGGDFILATKTGDAESYFRDKGFKDIFSWEELIL